MKSKPSTVDITLAQLCDDLSYWEISASMCIPGSPERDYYLKCRRAAQTKLISYLSWAV